MTTLEQFAAECRTILQSEPGPSGRRKICMRLEGCCAIPNLSRRV